MSWFDTVSETAGSVYDWFTDRGSGDKATPAPAPASAPASGSASGDAGTHWSEGRVGKALGIAPWRKWLGGGGDSSSSSSSGSSSGGRRSASELWNSGGDKTSTGVTGTGGKWKTQGFRDEDGKFKMPSAYRTRATGKTYGNRESDKKAAEKGEDVATKLPEVWQPDLGKLKGTETGVQDRYDASRKTTGADSQAGSFRSSKGGSYSGGTGLFATNDKGEWEPGNKLSIDHEGKGDLDIGGWQGQWGAEEKGGWRAVAVGEGRRQDGKANLSAQGEAGWVASGGASATAGISTKKGLYGQAGVGGKVGVYAQGDADAISDTVKIGGVDYDAGIGVHGETFAGAKAGASGEIGIGPDFVGAKGSAGAFIGAEAAGDVHGNLGPVGGKVGGSVMAGAGAGIEGDLSYKDGKLHIGGKMFAALGYGGSLSGGVTVDVGAIGRTGAHYAGEAYDAGAEAVDAVGDFAGDVYDGAGDLASDAYDTAGNAVSAVLSW